MIAVILVTDEDNSELIANNSYGEPRPQKDLDTSELTNYLENTLGRTKGVDYQIYGLLNPQDQASYQKIIDSANIQDVNSENYNTVLSNISGGIMNVLNKTLDISNIANTNGFIFNGLSIAGVDKARGTHYTINGNIITFKDDHIPQPTQEIIVKYSYTEAVAIRAKGLSYEPLPNTVTVTKVSGCGNWQSNHQVGVCNRGTKPCVIHATRPPDSCKIRYTYKMTLRV